MVSFSLYPVSCAAMHSCKHHIDESAELWGHISDDSKGCTSIVVYKTLCSFCKTQTEGYFTYHSGVILLLYSFSIRDCCTYVFTCTITRLLLSCSCSALEIKQVCADQKTASAVKCCSTEFDEIGLKGGSEWMDGLKGINVALSWSSITVKWKWAHLRGFLISKMWGF